MSNPRQYHEADLVDSGAVLMSVVMKQLNRPDKPLLRRHYYKLGSRYFCTLGDDKWVKAFTPGRYFGVVSERPIRRRTDELTRVPWAWAFQPRMNWAAS